MFYLQSITAFLGYKNAINWYILVNYSKSRLLQWIHCGQSTFHIDITTFLKDHYAKEGCDRGGTSASSTDRPIDREEEALAPARSRRGRGRSRTPHIGLEARIGFLKSIFSKPSIPQDSTHSPLSHYIPCISRLQRPPITLRH